MVRNPGSECQEGTQMPDSVTFEYDLYSPNVFQHCLRKEIVL